MIETKFLLCSVCDYILGKINYSYKLTNSDIPIEKFMVAFSTPQEHVCYCKHCKQFTTHYEVDEDIINIIGFLHNVGFKTKFSCSGHTYINNIADKDGNYFFEYYLPYLCIVKNDKAISEILPKIKDIKQYKNIKITNEYVDGFEYTDGVISFELDIKCICDITDALDLSNIDQCIDAKNKIDSIFRDFNTSLYQLITSIVECETIK